MLDSFDVECFAAGPTVADVAGGGVCEVVAVDSKCSHSTIGWSRANSNSVLANGAKRRHSTAMTEEN